MPIFQKVIVGSKEKSFLVCVFTFRQPGDGLNADESAEKVS